MNRTCKVHTHMKNMKKFVMFSSVVPNISVPGHLSRRGRSYTLQSRRTDSSTGRRRCSPGPRSRSRRQCMQTPNQCASKRWPGCCAPGLARSQCLPLLPWRSSAQPGPARCRQWAGAAGSANRWSSFWLLCSVDVQQRLMEVVVLAGYLYHAGPTPPPYAPPPPPPPPIAWKH